MEGLCLTGDIEHSHTLEVGNGEKGRSQLSGHMTAFIMTPEEAFLPSRGKAHLADPHGLGWSGPEPVTDRCLLCLLPLPELGLSTSEWGV